MNKKEKEEMAKENAEILNIISKQASIPHDETNLVKDDTNNLLNELNRLMDEDAEELANNIRWGHGGMHDDKETIEGFDFSDLGSSDIIKAEVIKRAKLIEEIRLKKMK